MTCELPPRPRSAGNKSRFVSFPSEKEEPSFFEKKEAKKLLCLAATALVFILHTASAAEDPFLWLEDVNGPKALDWVRAHDDKSLAVLQADTRYAGFYQQALTLEQAGDRIPMPDFLGRQIANFWQDASHAQGIWRATSIDEYRKPAPAWQTLLDLDALSKAEHHTWVFKGASCYEPDDARCLIALSEGGEDATTDREFDVTGKSFVSAGFDLPRAKQQADWETPDSLIVTTDWGPGSVTESGYPYIAKRLKRGQTLSAAQEVFRGSPQDVNLSVQTLVDGQGHRVVLMQLSKDFFHNEFRLVTLAGAVKLNLPEKADVFGLLRNQLIARINQDVGTDLKAGSIVALDLAHMDRPPTLVFQPNAKQTVDQVTVTANRIVAAIYDNVRGRALVFSPAAASWTTQSLALPDNASVSIIATNSTDDRVFLSVTGFLLPTTLFYADLAGTGTPQALKSLPPKFDASRDTVDQFEATSTDGTKIPYFVVHPRNMSLNGENPTLMTAYGGFQVSNTPTYSAMLGKLWLEHGGVYVLANIRGGGEFGPAWHDAGLKTKRQIIYDDFASVAKDLIAREITSPAHLGIRGGSNGGLLMGVEFEQHPNLWGAVIIDVPLLDMLRYEKIAAGASWVGEYGSVNNPDERAFLAKISPYNNLRVGVKYPTPFIFTTTRDDRVGPVHARKFAAKMESLDLPFYYYESIEGGHAAGANPREKAQEEALEMTYLHRALHVQ
jgi:prolyl oligopeptidase